LESAFADGARSRGVQVTLIGVAPSSAVSYLTSSLGFDGGAMVTASHNPATDNGVKLFGADGVKLSEAQELTIEALAFARPSGTNGHIRGGAVLRAASLLDGYIDFLRTSLPTNGALRGSKLVIDCANGAASDVARRVCEPLGINLVGIEDAPNGSNINASCGAVYPERMAERTRSVGARLGLALDGDADRAVFADESGNVIQGDQVLYALAIQAKNTNSPGANQVVGTILTNRGLEKALAAKGIRLLRTAVGDRHILAEMRATGASLGGEASGHYLFRHALPVSDGFYTCLTLLGDLLRSPSSAAPHFEPTHQVALNLPLERSLSYEQLAACERIAALAAAELGSSGRIVVRPSGTEPLLRIMVDADEPEAAYRASSSLRESLSMIFQRRHPSIPSV
jgi:phosphoglucosamine mutase